MFNEADSVLNHFKKASVQLKISVEDPYFIETDNEASYDEIKQQLLNYMMSS